MVKRVVVFFAMILTVLGVGLFPSWVLSGTIQTQFATQKQHKYQPQISVQGRVEGENKREIYLESPIIADQVNVSVGDRVEKGQVIARVNTPLTEAVLKDSISVYMSSAMPTIENDQMQALAKAYGISQETLTGIVGDEGAAVKAVAPIKTVAVPSKILSPVSGVVVGMNLSEQVLTQTSRPVVTIEQNDRLKIIFEIEEDDVQFVSLGDSVQISSDATIGQAYTGKVAKIYPAAQASSLKGTNETIVNAEVLISDNASGLKSGFSVSGNILIGEEKEIQVLPYEAIAQDENNIEYVYIWKQGRAERKNIQTGEELLHEVEVVKGLDPGDKILLNPEEISPRQLVLLKGAWQVD